MKIKVTASIDSFDADESVSVCDKTGKLVFDPNQVNIYEYALSYVCGKASRFYTYVCGSGLSGVFDTTDKRPLTITVTDEKPDTIDDDTLVFTRKAKRGSGIWGPDWEVESQCTSHRVQSDVRYQLNDLIRDVRGYNEDGQLCHDNGGETWYVWSQ